MKKIVLFGILAGCVFTSTAQNKGQVEFGVNLGVNTSTVSTNSVRADTGTGVNFGLSADYYFSTRWSIKTKLILDQKGWNNGFFEDEFNSYTTNYNLNYLTVPVMANYHFGRTKNWYLHFGPYVGFLLTADESSGGVDVTEAFNTTDVGLSAGVGVKIPVSNKVKLSLEYEGQSGFLDIFKGMDGPSVTNSRGAFNIGLHFLMK